jgi:hypothetical protein
VLGTELDRGRRLVLKKAGSGMRLRATLSGTLDFSV